RPYKDLESFVYNFTASAFVAAHSIGLACGIKPRFAACVKYNSRPPRFSSSSEKSILFRKYDSSARCGNSNWRAASKQISGMRDKPKSREARKSAATSAVAM